MRSFTWILAVTAVALTMPGAASAAPATGSDCDYAGGVPVNASRIYVHATPDQSGMSGDADVAVGACVNLDPAVFVGPVGLGGGTVEAGAGADQLGGGGGDGAYAIADGDNQNVDPTGASDGYAGVSTYEDGVRGNCVPGTGNGTNSGGCFEVPGVPGVLLPLPIACGNTQGNTWNQAAQDGCVPSRMVF